MAIGTLPSFNAPAKYTELGRAGLGKWSKQVGNWFDTEIAGTAPSGGPRQPLPQFFDPTKTQYELDQKPTPITWSGFPLKIRTEQPTDDARWAAAENPLTDLSNPAYYLPQQHDRENMDEYLEWSTLKDPDTGDVIIASFTCEGPEYWEKVAEYISVDKILDMYKEMNPDFADQMTLKDITTGTGAYKPRNKWNQMINTGTIAHLIQDNNTLSAEVDIAAQATVIRKDLAYGEIIRNITQLCGDASRYGNTKRNSDPAIGGEINTLARQGFHLSVADPVALYMHAADFSSFRLDPTGTRRGNLDEMIPVPDGTFQFLRGDISKGWGLHLKVKIPASHSVAHNGRTLNCSDLFDLNNGGQYVRYGSQFADYVTMSVSGVVGTTVERAAAQDSLTYTEPFVAPPVDLSLPSVVKEVSVKNRKEAEAVDSGKVFMMVNAVGVKNEGSVAPFHKAKAPFLRSRA
ncbi:hypothetical protein CC78DRAFT_524532 [Lojkania enalia]|uniref:Uncharacterized protein n=1 Tax=Lojkania enalia TaxID=147567 RepID=A0A9P4MZK1_9PLEO|nr:hypothetical protein CC78DRAFT_524532 [Didymosphaeria enalia]